MTTNSEESNTDNYKNISDDEYEQHFEWAKEQLRLIEKSKKDTINELAKRLEESGMKLELICSEICRRLEGYASDRYIRESLDTKYKDMKKQNKDIEKDAEVVPHQEIKVSTEGQVLEEKIEETNKAIQEHNSKALELYEQTGESTYFSKQDMNKILDEAVEQDLKKEPETKVTMNKKEANQFASSLKIDVLSRLPSNGLIEFTISKGKLTYRLL